MSTARVLFGLINNAIIINTATNRKKRRKATVKKINSGSRYYSEYLVLLYSPPSTLIHTPEYS
jgi:hypothetical protein